MALVVVEQKTKVEITKKMKSWMNGQPACGWTNSWLLQSEPINDVWWLISTLQRAWLSWFVFDWDALIRLAAVVNQFCRELCGWPRTGSAYRPALHPGASAPHPTDAEPTGRHVAHW
jgi:hypothetical protein